MASFIINDESQKTECLLNITMFILLPSTESFQTAIDQLHQTKLVKATQGAVMGVFTEARQIVEGAIEEVLNNKKSPQQALDDAAKEITTKIQDYNRTVK